jgi:hypothetical protein
MGVLADCVYCTYMYVLLLCVRRVVQGSTVPLLLQQASGVCLETQSTGLGESPKIG